MKELYHLTILRPTELDFTALMVTAGMLIAVIVVAYIFRKHINIFGWKGWDGSAGGDEW